MNLTRPVAGCACGRCYSTAGLTWGNHQPASCVLCVQGLTPIKENVCQSLDEQMKQCPFWMFCEGAETQSKESELKGLLYRTQFKMFWMKTGRRVIVPLNAKQLTLSRPLSKYSYSLITLRLNHWWQMKYSDDVFHTFLDLDSVNYLEVNGTVGTTWG